MAGNTIKGSEGIKQLTELYASLAKQIDLATQETNEFLSTTQKLPSQYIKSLEKLKTTQSGVSKGMDELTEKQKKVTAEQKESARVAREKIKVDARLTQATSKGAKELQKSRFELQKVRREQKLNIEGASALTGAFRKQTIILNRMIAQFKDVVFVEGAASKKALELERAITKLGGKIRATEQRAGQFGRTVGNYPQRFKLAASAVRSLASAMGLVGGAFLFVRVMRDAFDTVVKFNRQLIAVQKTTNLSSDEIKLFKNEVIELGLAMKGVSIQGLLQSSEVAGQLGIKGRENILGFAKAVELLKVSAKGIGEEAVVDFAKFIEVSKDSAENADRLASVITDLGNNFSTTEREIISSAIEIQKGTQLYNISAEAVLGLAAASSSLGVQDQAARTSIRKTLGVIQQSIFTGKNLNEVLKLTNLTEKELSEQFEKDGSQVFIKFLKGLKDINDSGGNTSGILKDMKLSGDRVAPTILSLAEKHERTARAVNSASEEYINNIALQREADLAAGSLSSIMGDLADNWDGFILSVESGDGPLSKFLVTSIKVLNTAIALNRILLTLNPEREKQNRVIDASFESTKKLLEAQERSLPVLQSVLKTEEKRLAFLRTQEKFNKLSEDELKLNFKKQLQTIGTIRALREVISATKAETNAIEKQKETIIDQLLVLDKSLKRMDLEKMTLSELKSRLIALNKVRKDGLNILKGSVAAHNKLIAELKEERDTTAQTAAEYEEFNKQIEALEKNLKRLKEAAEAVSEIDPITPGEIVIDEDEIKRSSELLHAANVFRIKEKKAADQAIVLLEMDTQQAIRELRKKTSEFTNNLNKEQKDDLKEALEFQLKLEKELQESKKDLIFTGIESIFEARVNAVDREIEQNRRLFADLLDNASLTEEQRSQLEAEREQKEEQLLEKKQKREQEAFIVQQGLAVAEIAINLAQTISAINLAAATIDAVTLGIGGAIYRAANIPIAIGIAAAQTGIVLAQTLAGFKEGGIAPGGDILVNDNETSNFKEVIRTPAGKILKPQKRNTVIDPPKGSEIFKSENEFTEQLNRELAFNGILSSVNALSSNRNNNNFNDERIVAELRSLKKTIDNSEASQIIFDERGVNKYIVRNNARIKILNNRFIGRGRKV